MRSIGAEVIRSGAAGARALSRARAQRHLVSLPRAHTVPKRSQSVCARPRERVCSEKSGLDQVLLF